MLADEYFAGVASGTTSELDDPTRVAIPIVAPQKTGGDSQLRVLVLEDDLVQLELLVDHLQSVGLITVGVTTVAEARTQLTNAKFSLAIFDVQVPDGSGLDLCNSIADDSRFCSMPTIVLSSMNQANMVRRTRAAGASFFIGKPYDPNVLLTVIERALGTELQ
jgi:CheY-like chemotaxis protein